MDGERMQQGIFIGYVVIVTRQDMGRVVGLETYEIGNMIPIEIQYVVNSVALLKQELGAIQVLEEGLTLLPPGNIGVQVRSGEVFIAR